jgi:protein MpaA
MPILLGHSVEGRPIFAWTFGNGENTTLFVGVVHGNEPGGKPLLQKLCAYLREHPEELIDRRVVVIPVLNPDGLVRRTRRNARGVDINRNFPTGNWKQRKGQREKQLGPASEPETQVLIRAVEQFRPTKIVTIHSRANCVDYDGPARKLAALIAEQSGYRVRRIGALPGSFGSYAGLQRGIPTITLELDRKYELDEGDALWARHKSALLAAIRWAPSSALAK